MKGMKVYSLANEMQNEARVQALHIPPCDKKCVSKPANSCLVANHAQFLICRSPTSLYIMRPQYAKPNKNSSVYMQRTFSFAANFMRALPTRSPDDSHITRNKSEDKLDYDEKSGEVPSAMQEAIT